MSQKCMTDGSKSETLFPFLVFAIRSPTCMASGPEMRMMPIPDCVSPVAIAAMVSFLSSLKVSAMSASRLYP